MTVSALSRHNYRRNLCIIFGITLIMIILSTCGCSTFQNAAHERIREGMMNEIVLTRNVYLVRAADLPLILKGPDAEEREQHFFKKALKLDGLILIRLRKFIWMMGQLGFGPEVLFGGRPEQVPELLDMPLKPPIPNHDKELEPLTHRN